MSHHRAVHRDGFEQTHAVASIAAILRQPTGELPPLFVAMKLAGREKDLPPAMAQNRSFDMYTEPALVANGRDADFAAFVKSRNLSLRL
jgi:hypothetical protein